MDERLAHLRARLVERLVANGDVRSERIAAAFARVPRHLFVPDVEPSAAYADRSIAIKVEQGVALSSSSQPAIMGRMLEMLDVHAGARVLEIGTGSGYNAALLAELTGEAGSVVSVDIDAALVDAARGRLDALGYDKVRTFARDGMSGDPDDAPFHAIIATVGVDRIPPAWIAQLREGGRLVAPVTVRAMQKVVAFVRTAHGLESRGTVDAAFIMLRGPAAAHDTADVALGADVVVRVLASRVASLDVAALVRALGAPHDVSPPRNLTPLDVWTGFATSLAIADGAFCTLRARGDAVTRRLIPHLASEPDDSGDFAMTLGLCDPAGIAAFAPSRGSHVVLRCYGDADAALTRLRRAIIAWDGAGRPGDERLRISVALDGTTHLELAAR